MDAPDFAQQFGQLYRELYRLAVRPVADGREPLSAETTALLMHLAQTGPMSLSELALHFGRALSTLSVKLAALEGDGLLARQRDDGDARRALIWLSPAGHQALQEALDVLDTHRLAAAAATLGAAQRQQLLDGMRALLAALPPHHPHHGDHHHDPRL
jgi:DNA-binding MarR family transcriptional regulator